MIFNGGELGGLIKIKELTDKLNALVNAFNTHVHPVAGSATSNIAQPVQPFNQADYEDEKIKH